MDTLNVWIIVAMLVAPDGVTKTQLQTVDRDGFTKETHCRAHARTLSYILSAENGGKVEVECIRYEIRASRGWR